MAWLKSIKQINLNLRMRSEDELNQWEMFWKYLEWQWMPIKDSWNFLGLSNNEIEFLHCTKNKLESYNRHFGVKIFSSKER